MSFAGGVLAPSASLLPLLLVLCASPPCHGDWSHNITAILAAHPEFSAFSAALSSTGAEAAIDSRNTTTVLAVDNATMAAAQRLHPEELKRVISLHVLFDYLDDGKLGSLPGGFTQVTSLYQASGHALGADGIVNVTTRQGGRVAFTAPPSSGAAPVTAFYKKTVEAKPYDIVVLQVDALISSPAAGVQAPAPEPAPVSAPAQGPAKMPPPAAPAAPPATPPPAAPATPPATPAPSPVKAPPATTPIPSPDDVDDAPPADQKNNGARGTASWTLGATVAAVVLTIMLVL